MKLKVMVTHCVRAEEAFKTHPHLLTWTRVITLIIYNLFELRYIDLSFTDK